jgi:hypothetical protein
MPDPRAAYAARFNARAIERPRPPAPPLTDEQFEAYVATLPPLGQTCARFARAMATAFPSHNRPAATAERSPHPV